MPKYKKIKVAKWTKDGKILIFERRLKKRLPTLKQYAIRKYFGSLASTTKGVKGVVRTSTGLIPKSSKIMRDLLKLDADDLITPELEREYNDMIESIKRSRKRK